MSLFLRTDVTAVKLLDDIILAGIGSYVNILNKTSNKLITRKEVLRGQKLYGFVSSPDRNKILIFGGKQFTIISLARFNNGHINLDQLFEAITCDDWLHSGVWINYNELGLLTAHNVVQIWNINKQCLISKRIGENNSILYSGLLLPLVDDVLVFAGTVFSDVIIHASKTKEPLHSLKGHRGVIFSVAYNADKEIIVTTSDDRSVRIWGPNNSINVAKTTRIYWETVDIVCKYEVYGHLARVMRCTIAENAVISVGEDAAICYWDLNGKLLNKSLSHQSGGIWCLDADKQHLVTGGGDSGIVLHPLTVTSDYGKHDKISIDKKTPKKLYFTARGNLIILCENDELVYYDLQCNIQKTMFKLEHESTYKLMSISSCKQIISVIDMGGNLDVFIETCKADNELLKVLNIKLNIGKILSMHWTGNRHIVFCSDNGEITVLVANASQIDSYAKFILPHCKERWLTAAAFEPISKTFAVGDRCGNIHIYNQNEKNPMKTFRKVHGRYGPTYIGFRNNEIVTAGRDGTVKYFTFGKVIRQMDGVALNFQWVEKFLDKTENIVCGFQERLFIVYDIKNCVTMLELTCGGGHRSWDANRHFIKVLDKYEECITIVYIKNSTIHRSTFKLNKIVSRNVIKGSHVKEINCLKTYKSNLDENTILFISGSEDTTLRISSLNIQDNNFQDKLILKYLSSVRCIKTYELDINNLLLISAGGRAQISVKKIIFSKENGGEIQVKSQNIINHLIKGIDRERKCNQKWRNNAVDFDPETRIMNIDMVKIRDNIFNIFAGCSDALLRVFKLTYSDNGASLFEITYSIDYHTTCILKTEIIYYPYRSILATASTIGDVALWNLDENENLSSKQPFLAIKTNKSGINGIASAILNENELCIATCGDDNSVHLVLLRNTSGTFRIIDKWCTDKYYCALVSGVLLFDNKYLLTVSLDQRITLSQWSVNNERIICKFISQYFSDVADIHGMDVVEKSCDSITVCVYGKGLEIIKIPIPR